MKFIKTTVFLFLAFSLTVFGQFKDYGTKGGLQFNGLLQATEFDNSDGYKFSYLARGFVGFEFFPELEVQLGIGFGQLAGYDNTTTNPTGYYWKTEIIPIDLRFRLNPFDLEKWNPYIYAGFGSIHYNVKTPPRSVSPLESIREGWAGFVPMGIGAEFALTEELLLDISGGFTYAQTDNLNNYAVFHPNDGYYNVGIGLSFLGESCSADKDQDGLAKCLEEELGTDPKNPDTDGDGLTDGQEVNEYKTNPLKADTDGDGLSDYSEVMTYKTDPNIADTDGDGLNDGAEVNTHSTDPLKADTDGDGLNDSAEVNTYKTNPNKADTDGDGLNDNAEITTYKTNPLKADTDGDGLNDGAEVNTFKTNPLNVDTDNGTVNDKVEVDRGTDPLNPKDDVILDIKAPVVLEGVTFATNSAELTPNSEAVLQQALNTLNVYPDMAVEIRGYTDATGSRSYNMRLSQRRAESVKNWLVAQGIDDSRITAIGYGPDNPIDTNDTPEGRKRNRRIEFVRIGD